MRSRRRLHGTVGTFSSGLYSGTWPDFRARQSRLSRDFATICVTSERVLHVFVTQLIHPSKGAGNNDLTGFLCTLNEKLSDIRKCLNVSGLSSSF